MNGTEKADDILSDVRIPFSAVPDPYRNTPPCKFNLLELARYADRNGKDISNLTQEEIALFKI
ncbi:hypothetical protein [Fibrobacter sp. UBA2449]|uniref:hypothetical protein n=1 Tax=Fibrobacter sp. UBA2449 TaxID=1946529 RepID=UPI0025C38678|nr:hypothetical protein [Fibrobacter sp. UBA2449]